MNKEITAADADYIRACQGEILALEKDYKKQLFVSPDRGQYNRFTRTWSLGAQQLRKQLVRNILAIFELALNIHNIDLTVHGMVPPEDIQEKGPFPGEGEGG